MADKYYSASYPNSYQQIYPYGASNLNHSSQYSKHSNSPHNYDIKASNISQQTIIHKARLYSPNKQRQTGKNSMKSTVNYDKTKQKKTKIASKIHQIVDLCQNDRDAQIQEFKDVLVAEKRILNMLQDNGQNQREVPNIDLSHFGDPHYDRGTTFGPIRTHNNYAMPRGQSRETTQRQVFYNQRQAAAKDNIYKKSAIDDLKTDRNLEQSYQPNIQGDIKKISDYNGPFNDQTQKIIQQIQRKAMEQIQSLRNDKIQLMRRLNQEIKAHNLQKKLRLQLQQQLARIKGQQVPSRTIGQQIQQVPPTNAANNEVTNNQKQEQKYYSQPHFQQQKPRPPTQTFFPPPSYQPHAQHQSQSFPPRDKSPHQHHPQVPHTQHPNYYQQRQSYQQQPTRPQYQNLNNQLFQTTSQNKNYGSKQDLKHEVAQLNNLANQYQFQIQRLKGIQGSNELAKLEDLLAQGQKIQQQTVRLLQQNAEQQQIRASGRLRQIKRVPTSENIIEDTNNFKRRLIEAQNQRSNRKPSVNGINVRIQSYQNIGSRKSIPKYSNTHTDQQTNRMLQFERILGDLRNAAR